MPRTAMLESRTKDVSTEVLSYDAIPFGTRLRLILLAFFNIFLLGLVVIQYNKDQWFYYGFFETFYSRQDHIPALYLGGIALALGLIYRFVQIRKYNYVDVDYDVLSWKRIYRIIPSVFLEAPFPLLLLGATAPTYYGFLEQLPDTAFVLQVVQFFSVIAKGELLCRCGFGITTLALFLSVVLAFLQTRKPIGVGVAFLMRIAEFSALLSYGLPGMLLLRFLFHLVSELLLFYDVRSYTGK